MTNAEAAELFAKLPPKREAVIMVIMDDNGVVSAESLSVITKEDIKGDEEVDGLKDYDGSKVKAGQPCIWIEYG